MNNVFQNLKVKIIISHIPIFFFFASSISNLQLEMMTEIYVVDDVFLNAFNNSHEHVFLIEDPCEVNPSTLEKENFL